MLWLALIAVLMWVLQLVLSILQFRRFAAHVKEMRREGRVAIGKAKGRFVAGAIVLFVIDPACRIVRGEIMKGVTVFAGFRSFDDFTGRNLRAALYLVRARSTSSIRSRGRPLPVMHNSDFVSTGKEIHSWIP